MGTTTITAEPGLPFIDVERDFDAPRELVFRAYTDPDLLVRWLGPRRYTMTVERWDVADGGTWRFIHSDDAGNAYGFHGVFHGAPSIDRLTQTFEFEGAPGHVSLETVEFVDLGDGRTRVHNHSVYQSLAARDAMVAGGMAEGMNEGFDRLDELLVPTGSAS